MKGKMPFTRLPSKLTVREIDREYHVILLNRCHDGNSAIFGGLEAILTIGAERGLEHQFQDQTLLWYPLADLLESNRGRAFDGLVTGEMEIIGPDTELYSGQPKNQWPTQWPVYLIRVTRLEITQISPASTLVE